MTLDHDYQEPADEAATRGLVSLHGEVIEPVPAKSAKGAAIYLRVSTNSQADNDYDAEGFSIPAQRDACTRKATEMGATVVAEFIDRGESARSADRPQLQAMLTGLNADLAVDYVIVHKVDRLARSREDDIAIGIRIRQSGARLVSATENIDETPSGKLMHGIMATIAEFYSSNLSAEARKGLQEKARRGGTISRAPLGYRNTREEFEGRLVSTVAVDEARREHVQWAFEEFTTGEWTLAQITEALEDRGLTSRATRRFPEGSVSRSRIHKILRNPYYLGIVTYDGVQYPGRHEPLISPTTFEAVQEVLDQRSIGKEKPVARTHYLKGMLACGLCGSRLGISLNQGNGGKYAYFFCLGRHGHRKNGCALPYIPVAEVEDKVLEMWHCFQPAEDHLDKVEAEVIALIEVIRSQQQRVVQEQRVRLQRVDAEERKLLNAHYADAISVELLKTEQVRIRKTRTAAQEQIDQLSLELDATRKGLDAAISLLRRCSEAYRAAGNQTRRALCFALFNRIWVGPEGGTWMTLRDPFTQILDPELPGRIQLHRAEAEGNATVDDTGRKTKNGQAPVELPVSLLPSSDWNRGLFSGHGSNLSVLVGVAGFEPTTSASRTQRSAKLSHTPVLCGGGA